MTKERALEKTTGKRSHFVAILTVSITTFLTLLNIHSINVALPTIAAELHISESKVSLIPQAYLIALCSFTLVVGKLSDRYNPKRLFLSGLLLFILASFLCGITDRFGYLVAWRGVQGASAAVLQTVGMLVLTRTIPAELRGKAFGINGMFASLGLLLGAPAGGLLTSFLGWHWAFLLCVPVCIIPLVFVAVYLPDMPANATQQKGMPLDIPGALLSACAFSSFMYGFHLVSEEGWTSPWVYGLLGGSLLSSGWLFYHLRHRADPIVDLRLFLNRPYALSMVVILFANLIITGNNFVIPFFLREVHQLASEEIGFVFLCFSVSYMLFSPIAGAVSDKITPFRTLSAGMLVCVVAYGYFLLSLPGQALYAVYLFLFLLGGGLSLVFIAGCAFSYEQVASDRLGEASAIYRLVGLLGATAGVNLFSGLLSLNASHTEHALLDYQWIYGICFGFGVAVLIPLLIFGWGRYVAKRT